MQLSLAIEIARQLALYGPDLYAQVKGLLEASDEPEAKVALASLKSAYTSSSADADEALRKRIGDPTD
jgi:hypothetical protein